MKTKILSIIVVLGLLSSCSLKEEPYGFYSEDNFYKTAADADAALMYAYNAMNFLEYSRGVFFIGELPTETIGVKPGEGYGAQELNSWKADATTEFLTHYFRYCYITINRANAVIENVQNSDFVPEVKNRILGEAYFIRAWNYFALVRAYGLVPIQRTMVKTVSQTTPSMAKSIDEIYNFIIEDLRTAEDMLVINKRVGRVDKVAAQGLLGKVYLTIASSKESGIPLYKEMEREVQTMYDSAAFFARKPLYDQTTYAIDPDLQNIYDVKKPDGVEHVFILPMDVTGVQEGNYSKIGMMFHPWVDGSPFYIENTNGTMGKCTNGWEVYPTEKAFYDTYNDNDKRKTELMVDKVYGANGSLAASVSWGSGKLPYAFTRKYVDNDFVGDKSSVKPFFLRFSDIALTFAEAAGPTAEGYFWLNKIRNRADIGDAAPTMSPAAFRDAVVQERAWEFAFEGQRLYDLRRKNIVKAKVSQAAAQNISDMNAAFFPIPQTEVDLNPNLK